MAKRSLQVEVTKFQNLTARTEVDLLKKKTKDLAKDTHVVLVELDQDCIVFEIPQNTCQVRHHICFAVQVKAQDKVVPFEATAIVFHLKKQDNKRDNVYLEMQQYESKDWDTFMQVFAQKQKRVASLLSTLKDE